MADHRLAAFAPDDVADPKDGVIRKWNDYRFKFLAQGDSWFSWGAEPAFATSNILQELVLGIDASAVNCAQPGQRLVTMVEWKRDRGFAKLLRGSFAEDWDGILLSGGGNDLICAAAVLPCYADGSPIPPQLRLLLSEPEWGPEAAGASRYVSDAGWATFTTHLSAQFRDLVAARDSGINRNKPLFCHCYDYIQPRRAPAGPGAGPWLYPSCVAYGIPPDQWSGVVRVLIDRLWSLLADTIAALNAGGDKRLYLVDTRGTLDMADPGSEGKNRDWENEMHPTRTGYRKLAARWRPVIDAQF